MMIRIGNRLFRSALVLYLGILAVLIVPGFFGIQVDVVTSGSMEPAICTGSIVYSRKTAQDKIRSGDIITYLMEDQSTKVTHRVTRMDCEKGWFYTKGDANEKEDARPVFYENIAGKVVCSIPYLGRVSVLLMNGYGKATLLSVLFLLILGEALTEAAAAKKNLTVS